jgi:hypothetical protein
MKRLLDRMDDIHGRDMRLYGDVVGYRCHTLQVTNRKLRRLSLIAVFHVSLKSNVTVINLDFDPVFRNRGTPVEGVDHCLRDIRIAVPDVAGKLHDKFVSYGHR